LFPLEIYADLLAFETELHQMAKDKRQFELTGNKASLLKALEGLSKARYALGIVYES